MNSRDELVNSVKNASSHSVFCCCFKSVKVTGVDCMGGYSCIILAGALNWYNGIILVGMERDAHLSRHCLRPCLVMFTGVG